MAAEIGYNSPLYLNQAYFNPSYFLLGQEEVVQPPVQPPVLAPAAHRNLFRPIRGAATPDTRVEALGSLRFYRPEVYDLIQGVWLDPYRIEARSQIGIDLPVTGVVSPEISVNVTTTLHKRRPRCVGTAPFVRTASVGVTKLHTPEAGCATNAISVAGKAHHAYWTPETVQNLTEEMILLL